MARHSLLLSASVALGALPCGIWSSAAIAGDTCELNGTSAAGGATAAGATALACGAGAQAGGSGSVAVGNGATASATGSVALGSGSVATQANTVSVGSTTVQRRIVNVAPGTAGTDAVNLNQMRAADTTLQNNINAEATARATADTNLGNRITSETTARQAAEKRWSQSAEVGVRLCLVKSFGGILQGSAPIEAYPVLLRRLA